MENLGYYNGKYSLIEEMMIPFNDRVHFFGDGVYDATCSVNGKILFIDEHIDRFFNSSKLLKINLDYEKEELKNILYEMLSKVDSDINFVYWQQTRGTATRKHEFPDVPSNLWIMIKPATLPDFEKRIKLTEMEDHRFEYCNIKTLNLIPSVLGAQKSAEEKCTECVFHRGEIVTECAHSNISILKDGVFITHPLDCHILPGIARAHLIKACGELGIPVNEREFSMDELKNADEIIVSSSSKFCLIADRLNGETIGGKDYNTVKKIQQNVINEFRQYCEIQLT